MRQCSRTRALVRTTRAVHVVRPGKELRELQDVFSSLKTDKFAVGARGRVRILFK